MSTQPQEIRGEALMAQKGRPVAIASTDKLAPTVLHTMSIDDVVDALYVEVFNSSDEDRDVHLILSPTNTASGTAVDAATLTLTIAAKNSALPLQGIRFRRTGQPYVLAAYCDSGAEADLRAIGLVNRLASPELTL